MFTAWDVWQFRNDLVHGPRGVKEKALHASLDEEIRDQLAIGYDDLLHQDKVLFQGKREELFGKSIAGKRDWLRTVRCARKAANLPAPVPNAQPLITTFFAVRRS